MTPACHHIHHTSPTPVVLQLTLVCFLLLACCPLLPASLLAAGAYFFNLLFNYYNQAGLFQPGALFNSDPTIHDAVLLILRTWKTEQHHETDSP